MKITVTQNHIDKATRGHGTECALALAIQERLPERDIGVGFAWVFEGSVPRYQLPPEIEVWRESFDLGRKVSPITFDLAISG